MDALTAATWALVGATAVLAVVAILQLLQMRGASTEASRQTSQFKKQADLLAASLDVSRAMLAEAKIDREEAAPFTIAVELHRDTTAGSAFFWFSNPNPGVVLLLRRVEVVEMPGEAIALEENLAEGTIGAGEGEGWLAHFVYDLQRTGATYYVRAIGHRVGGPTMTREFPYRVGNDGRLIDLSEGPPAMMVWVG